MRSISPWLICFQNFEKIETFIRKPLIFRRKKHFKEILPSYPPVTPILLLCLNS